MPLWSAAPTSRGAGWGSGRRRTSSSTSKWPAPRSARRCAAGSTRCGTTGLSPATPSPTCWRPSNGWAAPTRRSSSITRPCSTSSRTDSPSAARATGCWTTSISTTRRYGRPSTRSRGTARPAPSTGCCATAAVSSPTAWGSARPGRRSRSSSSSSCATSGCWCCARRSWRRTGSATPPGRPIATTRSPGTG